MKKIKNIYKISMILIALVVLISIFTNCFATVSSVVVPTGTDPALTDLRTASSKAWSVIRTLLQVVALSAFMFAGVKYMFVSAEQKAELKKSLTMVALGALITFGSTIVVDVIIKIFNDITS